MTADLSYSGITDLIQNVKLKGADLLVEIAIERQELKLMIEQKEKELEQLKNRLSSLDGGARHVISHLKLKTPLFVKRSDFIVLISDTDTSIEKNVI